MLHRHAPKLFLMQLLPFCSYLARGSCSTCGRRATLQVAYRWGLFPLQPPPHKSGGMSCSGRLRLAKGAHLGDHRFYVRLACSWDDLLYVCLPSYRSCAVLCRRCCLASVFVYRISRSRRFDTRGQGQQRYSRCSRTRWQQWCHQGSCWSDGW